MTVPLEVGQVLNDSYELEQVIGRGGMGEVWRARHLRLPRPVAVKVLTVPAWGGYDATTRFRREAEICSALGHPNIVQVIDFNTLADGRPYFVMELLDGEDLETYLQREAPSVSEVVDIVSQIASGLEAAHRAGVVHRDLKPANIFLGREPTRVKILDFGISKMHGATTALTQEASIMGTPGYMAPEQALGELDSIGEWTDQFSLAVICYEMVSGQVAFSGDSVPQIMYGVVHHDPPAFTARPGFSSAFITAIHRGMAKQPEDRHPSLRAFVDALRTAQLVPEKQVEKVPETQVISGHGETIEEEEPEKIVIPTRSRSQRAVPWMAGVAVFSLAAVVAVDRWRAPESNVPATNESKGGAERPNEPQDTPVLENKPEPTPAEEQQTSGAVEQPSVTVEPDLVPETDSAKPTEVRTADKDAQVRGAGGRRPSKSPRGTALPREARALLDKAKTEYDRGKFNDALHHAHRSLRIQESPEAIALMGRIHCARRDLGMANAMRRRLRGKARRQLEQKCRALGLRLGG